MDPFIAQSVAAIAADTVSGAVEIAKKCAEVLARAIRSRPMSGRVDVQHEVLTVGRALMRSHPTVAPLVNLVNSLLWRLEEAGDSESAIRLVDETTNDFRRRLHVHEAAIAETTLRLIGEEARILTIGRSTTVRAALRHAHRAGRRPRVICTESRPLGEGRMLAGELAASGIHTTLIADASAATQVAQCNLVLVGADLISSDGLINRVGTYPLALAAQAAGVPIYTLCSSEKLLPSGYRLPTQSIQSIKQLWTEVPPGITVHTAYCDRTPLDLLTGIISERGIAPPVGIEAWLAATHLHPLLRNGLDEPHS
ncbi:MAG: translation initiation factor eIF-2B [Chloroflexus sp.]|uniref:translation initiation factor eIF-2B n=1 Tax=Chloroflexus sp. TaxID=1904827 RepID=UPI003D0F6E1C